MKSPSAKMRSLGARAEVTLVRDLRRCQHPQAEPVILSTGELVACVCIGCFGPLPADYIERQAETAHLKAYCVHEDSVEITAFGSRDRTHACRVCGAWVSDSTWPTVNLG